MISYSGPPLQYQVPPEGWAIYTDTLPDMVPHLTQTPEDGSNDFVNLVHDGIEHSDMQLTLSPLTQLLLTGEDHLTEHAWVQ